MARNIIKNNPIIPLVYSNDFCSHLGKIVVISRSTIITVNRTKTTASLDSKEMVDPVADDASPDRDW